MQSSTNLTQWQDAGAFVAVESTSDFSETSGGSGSRVFYRIVDRGSVPPPPNDYFTNRITLSGSPAQALGYNVGATPFSESGEPNLGWNGSVWYSWTAPASATYAVNVETTGFAPAIGVYTGSAVNALTTVAANSFAGNIPFTATAGQIYQFKIANGFSFFGGVLTGGFKLIIHQF